MEVILISRDSQLLKMCREILADFPGVDWHLEQVTQDELPPNADFYIWDAPQSFQLPPGVEQRFSKHLILVPRNDVGKLQEYVDGAAAAILLKPVTRACLSAFLGLAADTFVQRTSASNSLRADRDEMLQCLIQSNLQLQKYDQDRTNFLTRAVHDFRAPLTATSGYCSLLLSGALGPLTEDQEEVLRRMQHSTKRLSRMSSAMFELSVGRHVRKHPELRKVEIRDCVEQALHETAQFSDGKKISISVDVGFPTGEMYLDPGQIEQVLINLLDNACKFTPRNGSIEVRGYPFFWERRGSTYSSGFGADRRSRDSIGPNSYRMDVRGSGLPIPQEHLHAIFEEYLSYGGSQDRSGGGLGLAICRMIIDAHMGRVWAENTEHGPRFSFVLPIRSSQFEGADIAQTPMIHSEECE